MMEETTNLAEVEAEAETNNLYRFSQQDESKFSTPPFPVDAERTRVEVLDKKRGIILVHSLKTPNINQASEYERNTAIRSEVNDDEEITPKAVSDRAAAALYDSLCDEVVIRRADDEKFSKSLAPEEIRRLTNEQKADAIDRFLNNLHVEVSSDTEADEFDFLFETESNLRVDVRLGRKKDEPDFAFAFLLARPDAQARESARDTLSKTKFKRNDAVTNTSTTQNVSAAVRFFDKHFLSGENLLVAGGEFDAGRRDVFLKAFNPKWKAQIVREVLNFF